MRNLRLMYVVVAAMWIFGAIMLPQMPDPSPTHWNAAGEVDGYGSPLFNVLLPAAVATLMALLAPLLPRLDPRGAGYTAFAGTYALIMNSLTLFFAALQVVLVGVSVGWPLSVPRVLMVGMALLMVALGNELGRVQPNFFVGIRTPWTLADPEVWRITHRVGGRLMVGGGLLAVLLGLLLPEAQLFLPVFLLIIVPALATIPYSYWVWRARPR